MFSLQSPMETQDGGNTVEADGANNEQANDAANAEQQQTTNEANTTNGNCIATRSCVYYLCE